MSEPIHVHSGDPRFCGIEGTRRFTVRDSEVTCLNCLPENQAMMLSRAQDWLFNGSERSEADEQAIDLMETFKI